ncbi:DUF1364 family protein [Pseudorhodoferax sp. LjRoot39]|uniref:nuclease domain-containing protein n=1 Tax=Pseudorhodoferax sp. LjRoot39 TaxID=3342328 RepID=UPI003ECE6F04
MFRSARREREDTDRREREKAARLHALANTVGRAANMGPADLLPAPKDVPGRNAAVLEMAHGRPCLLIAVPGCHGLRDDHSTTVACHQNEGKGMGTKRPDQYSVWGCIACHQWLDQSGAPRETKRARFLSAHVRQVDYWRHIATSPAEPVRYRNGAQWALQMLNATPVIDLETAP